MVPTVPIILHARIVSNSYYNRKRRSKITGKAVDSVLHGQFELRSALQGLHAVFAVLLLAWIPSDFAMAQVIDLPQLPQKEEAKEEPLQTKVKELPQPARPHSKFESGLIVSLPPPIERSKQAPGDPKVETRDKARVVSLPRLQVDRLRPKSSPPTKSPRMVDAGAGLENVRAVALPSPPKQISELRHLPGPPNSQEQILDSLPDPPVLPDAPIILNDFSSPESEVVQQGITEAGLQASNCEPQAQVFTIP